MVGKPWEGIKHENARSAAWPGGGHNNHWPVMRDLVAEGTMMDWGGRQEGDELRQ